jgi:hypothetical protein
MGPELQGFLSLASSNQANNYISHKLQQIPEANDTNEEDSRH